MTVVRSTLLAAVALGLAEVLASRRDEIPGIVKFVFQPAEESAGGALRMMEDGLFDRYPCDAVFAMHNMPGIPQGRLVLREGAAMASSEAWGSRASRGQGSFSLSTPP